MIRNLNTDQLTPMVFPERTRRRMAPFSRALATSSRRRPTFNLAAFTAPGPFQFGNESRTDNQLRVPGIVNGDLALFKKMPLTEKVIFTFRVESLNLFNRVQFGGPNTAIGNSLQGRITKQANDPACCNWPDGSTSERSHQRTNVDALTSRCKPRILLLYSWSSALFSFPALPQ